MMIDEVMKNHGFNLSASCAGKASYTKWVKYQGKRAYITINDASGESFPINLEEPVRVTLHDLKSGNELEAPQEVSSLSAYLESLQEQEAADSARGREGEGPDAGLSSFLTPGPRSPSRPSDTKKPSNK